MGAEKRPTWEDILCRPQHQDYYLGKTTATTTRVNVSLLLNICLQIWILQLLNLFFIDLFFSSGILPSIYNSSYHHVKT